jgi:hypothetical protein
MTIGTKLPAIVLSWQQAQYDRCMADGARGFLNNTVQFNTD